MSEKLYDIFISYSSKDAKVINALTHYLEERCLRCFVAYRDVPYGEDWAPHILKAVKDGVISEKRLNESVTRILELKIKRGVIMSDTDLLVKAESNMAPKTDTGIAESKLEEEKGKMEE